MARTNPSEVVVLVVGTGLSAFLAVSAALVDAWWYALMFAVYVGALLWMGRIDRRVEKTDAER